MTLSLAAVFIPVMFMGGIVGRLLHELAITICAAIFISGFVSLTLTPMLAAASCGPRRSPAMAGFTCSSSASSTPCCGATTGA